MENNENSEYKINYDGAWKQLITKQFKYFLEFFYAFVAQQVDWSKGFEFLDKEFEKLFPEANESKKYADKLVKLFLKDGSEQWVLVHLEIQNYKDETISERMFTYYYKILDLYKKKVISLLLLTDPNNDWRPNIYITEICGTSLCFKYNMAKLLDFYNDDLEEKEINNPFELATLTHIKALNAKEPEERYNDKIAVFKVMAKAYKKLKPDFELSFDMFIFLDWLLRLPKELNEKFRVEAEKIKGENKMEIMSISPMFQDTYQQGIEQGIEQGYKAFVSMLSKLGKDESFILNCLQSEYNLTPEIALQKYKLYHN